jgi:hypothetical protein
VRVGRNRTTAKVQYISERLFMSAVRMRARGGQSQEGAPRMPQTLRGMGCDLQSLPTDCLQAGPETAMGRKQKPLTH